MNLKQQLMILGNRLVTECGFDPANSVTQMADALERIGQPKIAGWMRRDTDKTTQPIVAFTNWLNNTPEAQEILAEAGIEWPVVHKENA